MPFSHQHFYFIRIPFEWLALSLALSLSVCMLAHDHPKRKPNRVRDSCKFRRWCDLWCDIQIFCIKYDDDQLHLWMFLASTWRERIRIEWNGTISKKPNTDVVDKFWFMLILISSFNRIKVKLDFFSIVKYHLNICLAFENGIYNLCGHVSIWFHSSKSGCLCVCVCVRSFHRIKNTTQNFQLDFKSG